MQQHGPLAEIIQHQRRHHQKQPRRLNRRFAEMTKIGIERLGPRDRQKDCPQRHQPNASVAGQKLHCEVR